jgi:hypothetical protein
MRRTTTTIATGVLVCLVSLPSWGLGFARLINATTLGQPLDVTIELASDPTEFLAADCVRALLRLARPELRHILMYI